MASSERRTQPQRGASVSKFDFRRPGAFSREAVRSLAAVHELFGRRVATGWGGALRAMVQVEEVSLDQATYSDFLASMPNPNALATVSLAPLPGQIVVEMGVELALVLVDRLLGSSGPTATPDVPRRLTDVETALLRHLLAQVVAGLDDALGGLLPVQGQLETVEYNPQLVQVTAPSDRVVLLTYRIAMTQGMNTEGLLTVCYPTQALTPIVDRILKQMYAGREDSEEDRGPTAIPIWNSLLQGIEIDVAARLQDTDVPARDLAALQVGDVLRLDHRVDEPVALHVGGSELVKGHVGRRGRRLAVQLASDLPAQQRDDVLAAATDLAASPRATPTPPLTPAAEGVPA